MAHQENGVVVVCREGHDVCKRGAALQVQRGTVGKPEFLARTVPFL